MSDEGEYTNKYVEAIVRERAAQALATGLGIGGAALTDAEMEIAQALSRGQRVILEASEAKELGRKLGTDNLPKTVEQLAEEVKAISNSNDYFPN